MNHLFVPQTYSNAAPSTYGSAAMHYDMGSCQSQYAIYADDSGSGRTMFAAAAAAEAAATAAAAAVAAAGAAQEAAYAANAVTGNANACTTTNYNSGGQGNLPFPARRRKLRPDDSWRKMPHQEGWRSFAWDSNRARSHKKQSDRYGAERGSPSKSRRVSKQRPQQHSQPQQQWRVRRSNYKGGHTAAEAGGHRTKAKDGQPRNNGFAGVPRGNANHARHSSSKKSQQAAAEILELLIRPVNVSTQTLADEAVAFSLSKCDSDDDEADFFPIADGARGTHKEQHVANEEPEEEDETMLLQEQYVAN